MHRALIVSLFVALSSASVATGNAPVIPSTVLDGPGFYTAYGFEAGGFPDQRRSYSPQIAWRLAWENGYRSIAVQLNLWNRAHRTEIMRAAANYPAVSLQIWETPGKDQTAEQAAKRAENQINLWHARAYHANIEGLHFPSLREQQRFPAALRKRVGPNFPLAIVSNMSGIETPALFAPWKKAGWVLIVESYLQEEDGRCTPQAMDRRGRDVGAPFTIPVVGTYHDFELDLYLPLMMDVSGEPSRGVWVFLFETTSERSLDVRW